MENNVYDLIIIGAGPAGLTASIYASCFHLKHLVIGTILGGQLQYAPDILNYPGFESISGKELTEKMATQARNRGGEIIIESVTKINKYTNKQINTNNPINGTMKQWNNETMENGFEVETMEGKKYQARAIVLATGTERRKLGVPGEIEYTGRGVHYCATCEKQDYAGKVCAIVGGANSAVQAAVEVAQAAAKVYIIYRGTELRGDPIWLEHVEKNEKIEVMYGTVVQKIVGDGEKVIGVKLQSTGTGPAPRVSDLSIDKIFIEIGGVPGTALVIPLGVAMDAGGYIKVNERLATNVPGVFAAGDLVSYGLSIEQISSAVGLGARAAASSFAYLKQEKAPNLWGGSQIKR